MAKAAFPRFGLQKALAVPRTIVDQNAGAPMNRLLVADAMGIKPASSNFKGLLSASKSYGLTDGTEKASEISLRDLGRQASAAQADDARVQAVLAVDLFRNFFERFDGNKLPSSDMMKKLLEADFNVSPERSESAVQLLTENGEFVGIIREISGSRHVMLDGATPPVTLTPEAEAEGGSGESDADSKQHEDGEGDDESETDSPAAPLNPTPKAIFIGHGKNKGPLKKLESILNGFQIPHRIAVDEPNLGRPIPTKVKELMLECSSAILIFTKDEMFQAADGGEIWRPSENVVHELGAASFAYEDRVVIFKESGIQLPTNFASVGYIEFEEDGIEAKTAELLQELIGFGLVKVTPTA